MQWDKIILVILSIISNLVTIFIVMYNTTTSKYNAIKAKHDAKKAMWDAKKAQLEYQSQKEKLSDKGE
jgi:hypothetical protein